MDSSRLNGVSGAIVDAAIEVHRALGPGLLESAYEACLGYELRKRGLRVEAQVALPIVYESVRLEIGYHLYIQADLDLWFFPFFNRDTN